MTAVAEAKAPFAALVLAAGASRRLGQPKQLVPHRGRPLLSHTVEAALAAGFTPVTVVLGAQGDVIRRQLGTPPSAVSFVENTDWAEGMGSSIRAGLRALLDAHPATTGVFILVCDQPALDAALLQQFRQRAIASPASIWVADYGTGQGPPVFFPRSCFDELLALQGECGARSVIRSHSAHVQRIAFPDGDLDLDTPADLARLHSQKSR